MLGRLRIHYGDHGTSSAASIRRPGGQKAKQPATIVAQRPRRGGSPCDAYHMGIICKTRRRTPILRHFVPHAHRLRSRSSPRRLVCPSLRLDTDRKVRGSAVPAPLSPQTQCSVSCLSSCRSGHRPCCALGLWLMTPITTTADDAVATPPLYSCTRLLVVRGCISRAKYAAFEYDSGGMRVAGHALAPPSHLLSLGPAAQTSQRTDAPRSTRLCHRQVHGAKLVTLLREALRGLRIFAGCCNLSHLAHQAVRCSIKRQCHGPRGDHWLPQRL